MAIFSRSRTLSRRRRSLLMPADGVDRDAETGNVESELREPAIEPPRAEPTSASAAGPVCASPPASQEEVIRALRSALSTLRRDFHEQSSRNLELLGRLVDSAPDELREQIFDEISRLRCIESELADAAGQGEPPLTAQPTAAGGPARACSAVPVRAPAEPTIEKPRSFRSAGHQSEAGTSPRPTEPAALSAASCGRVAQRIARAQQQRTSGWKRLLRSLSLLS